MHVRRASIETSKEGFTLSILVVKLEEFGIASSEKLAMILKQTAEEQYHISGNGTH